MAARYATAHPPAPPRLPLRVRAVRTAHQLLARVAPQAAVRRAAVMFFTPRRRPVAEPVVEGHGAERFEVRVGGERLAAWSWGAGPAVLLAHGWEGHAGQFAPLIGPLVARGFRAVAFDMPAHGRSTGRTTTMIAMADAIRAVDAAAGGAQAVVAHSLGAAAAAVALGDGLGARRAALLAPAAEPSYFVRRLGAFLGFGEGLQDDLVRYLETLYGAIWEQARVPERVRSLDAAALVLHDPADFDVPIEHGRRIAAAWPGAVFEAVEGVGHRRILREPPVVERVVKFVAAA